MSQGKNRKLSEKELETVVGGVPSPPPIKWPEPNIPEPKLPDVTVPPPIIPPRPLPQPPTGN